MELLSIKMKVFFALTLAVATAGAGPVDISTGFVHKRNSPILDVKSSGRITNGEDAAAGQFPYQVGLNCTKPQGVMWCGGTLIANNWVLTAAHCAFEALNITVLLGSTQLTSPQITQNVNSSNFIIHPNFDYDVLRYDVALIKISPISFNHFINKVRLPAITAKPSTYVNQTVIASGWGLVNETVQRLSPSLQFASMQVVSKSDCAPFYATQVIGDDIICTSNIEGISACYGDSGGPLTEASTGELIGLFSYVPDGGCEKGGPAAFTSVPYYAEWIKENSGVSF